MRPSAGNLNSDQALRRLLEGNRSYVATRSSDSNRRLVVASVGAVEEETPFAMVISCSDLEVSPEAIFDEGGALLVVQVGGNVLNAEMLKDIESAVDKYNLSLLMVMGHMPCGIMDRALKVVERDEIILDHFATVIEAIRPAIESAHGQVGDPVENVVRANVELTVGQLKSSVPILADRVKEGLLKVVGALYYSEKGKVKVIS